MVAVINLKFEDMTSRKESSNGGRDWLSLVRYKFPLNQVFQTQISNFWR